MIKGKKASSIAEAMIILLIVVTWVVWMFQVYWKSNDLAISTENKIQAIQIAREWIEWVKNIRDTNSIMFWADLANCWNILDYNWNCVWNIWWTKMSNWSYVLYSDTSWRWFLSWATTSAYNSWYINSFRVNLDSNLFFTQSWWTNFFPLFTREIIVSEVSANRLKVSSLVQWKETSSTNVKKVKFDAVITNWK